MRVGVHSQQLSHFGKHESSFPWEEFWKGYTYTPYNHVLHNPLLEEKNVHLTIMYSDNVIQRNKWVLWTTQFYNM